MKLKAMIVDDSKVMRNLVKQSLTRSGLAEFDFIEAADGEEALEKFDPAAVDIVFADWNMPRLNGINLAKRIRSRERDRRIPIVMVTSERSLGKVETALEEVGADAYVCKPFTVDELRSKIQRIVERLQRQGSGGKASKGFFKKLIK
jgi:two-component system chemotaxis response regulator CheY